MVHYIRLLSTPQINQDAKKRFLVNAVVTITTDLGDSLYACDTELLIRLVDANRPATVIQTQTKQWQAGSRAVRFSLQLPNSCASRLARLHVTTRDTEKTFSSFASSDVVNVWPEVLDVWSQPFSTTSNARTDPFVERRLPVNGKCVVHQWEEMGESIARHIWDASLGFLILFRQLFIKPESLKLPTLANSVFDDPKSRMRVLEVGSGCGLVGIAWSQLRKSDVILTDLEDAQEILQRNVQAATPSAGSSLRRQVLEWGSGLSELEDPKFDLILVSDCIYNPDSSLLLVDTLYELAKHNPNVLIVVGYKRRHDADDIFFDRMKKTGFSIVEQYVVPLPHTMTDYDEDKPQMELSIHRQAST